MSKSWQPYARHVLDAIARIRRIEARGDLTTDEVLYDASLRNLQTLSEATRLLPEHLKAAHENVPWRDISGFRNILVHDYLGSIDAKTVAEVVRLHLAPLEAAVRTMLEDPSDG